jgi:hypothetical protein
LAREIIGFLRDMASLVGEYFSAASRVLWEQEINGEN